MNDNTKPCDMVPIFRYTWPGKNEMFACAIHSFQVNAVADAMGLYLQFINLTPDEMESQKCSHTLKEVTKNE